ACVRRIGQGQPGVADYNCRIGSARLDEAEQRGVAGDTNNDRIDLVIVDGVVRPGMTGQRAGPQADHGVANGAADACTHRVDHLTEWRSVEVVGEGLRTSYLRPARGVAQTLRPVDDESMRQYPKLSALGLGDSVHAEEAAQENGGAAPFGKKIV